MNYVHNAGLIVDGVKIVDVAVIGTVDGIPRETNTRHYYNIKSRIFSRMSFSTNSVFLEYSTIQCFKKDS